MNSVKRTNVASRVLLGAYLVCGLPPAHRVLGQASQAQASAAGDQQSEDALRKAAQNPVANLISVPIQNNNNFNIGPYNRVQDVLNIQPVIPVKLNPKWNLITRTIQPIIWQPYSNQTTGGEYGLGDMKEVSRMKKPRIRASRTGGRKHNV